jgi:SagB-type dehydrogenase family enzyme
MDYLRRADRINLKKELIMDKRNKKKSRSVAMSESPVSSKTILPIKLPRPTLDGGTSVLKSLQQRETIREISNKKLSLQVLSNLLWAACGVNRKKGPFGIPGRTAATASNSQEIDLYIAFKDGIYLYNAVFHRLEPIATGDLRALAISHGQPGYAADAPVHIIYIADVNKLSNTSGYQEPGLQDPDVQKAYYYVDTGIIAGNIYLFAASFGLASWFHNCNKSALKATLNLRTDQRILFGQTVGYPEKQ